jgi:signal transduction histidine kinase
LNAILGMVDLTLATTKVDATQASYLAAVQHASESLLVIINDILDVSKIESGKLLIVKDLFEMGKLLEQTISPYRYENQHVVYGIL